MTAILVNDIVESNGKTVKENNLGTAHKIPIGTLVEVYWENGEYNGLRLFVVSHDRDCDGTPLYGLSFEVDAAERVKNYKERLKVSTNKLELVLLQSSHERYLGSILDGISDESLTVVSSEATGD